MMKYTLLAVPALLVGGLTLSACSSSHDSAHASAGPTTSVMTVPTTAAATTTASAPPTVTTSAPQTTPTGGTGPATTTQVPVPRAQPCLASALVVSVNQLTNHESGHDGYLIRFTNIGAPACTLIGFPGVDAVNRSGTALAHATRNSAGTGGVVQVFLLGRTGYAEALLSWADVGASGPSQCASTAPAIAVTPPNTTATKTYPNPVGLCSFAIHPVYGT